MALDPASMAALQAVVTGGNAKAASDKANEAKITTKGIPNQEPVVKIENPYAPKAVDGSGQKVEAEKRSAFDTEDPLKQFFSEEGQEEGEAKEASEQTEESSEEAPADGSTETLWVKGPNGKRQKLTIDYNNKEAIKKAYIGKAGLEKFREDRDQALNQYKAYKQEVSEDLQVSKALQEAYERHGIDGVIGLIGGEGAVEAYVKQKQQELRVWEEATPSERRAMEAQKAAEQASKSKTDLEKRLEEMEKKLQSKDVEYEQKNIETMLHSSYNKYSFEGALGDEAQEAELNDLLWMRVTRTLEEYPEDEPITKAMVEQEFKKAATTLGKMVKAQGKKQATKIVEKQKKKAAESVQHKAKTGMNAQSQEAKAKQEFGSLLKGGNLVSAMQVWAKNSGFKR